MELSLRITHPDYCIKKLSELLDPICDRYIIAVEHAKQRHFQCYISYIQDDDFKNSKLRYLIQKTFGKGNKHFSISKQKNDNLKIYCLKESNEVLTKGFTDQEITDLKDQSYEKPTSYSEKKKLLGERYIKDEINGYTLSRELLNLIIEHRIAYNKNKIKDWINTLNMAKDTTYYQQQLIELQELTINKNIAYSQQEQWPTDDDELESLTTDEEELLKNGLLERV